MPQGTDTINNINEILEPLVINEPQKLDLEKIPINFAYTTVYFIIISGIILYAFFRVVNYILPIFVRTQKRKKIISRFLPIIQLIFWVIYFVVTINHLWATNLFYGSGFFIIFMILSAWACWYGFRDFIAGAFFKFNNHFNINESIRFKNIHGKVIKQESKYMIIENEQGEKTYLPYSKLAGEIIIKTHPAENILHYRFKLKLPNELDADETSKNIKTNIMKLPWVSIKKEPNVKIIQMDENITTFEITVFSPSQQYFYLIEENIRNRFEEANG
ncbi:MAG: mechanosensitive ion channel domain-containing protein [Bacteroidales bacterium]